MTFELNGSKPIYKQLIDEILAKIRSGELRPEKNSPQSVVLHSSCMFRAAR